MKGSSGNEVEMRWVAAPHPGQALEAIPWTSRTVNIDHYDSAAVSGVEFLRERAKGDVNKVTVGVDSLACGGMVCPSYSNNGH